MEADRPVPDLAAQLKKKYVTTAEEYYDLLSNTGLYPDIEDQNFVKRLLSKYEFADTMSTAEESENACDANYGFEISPVQRFVANFLHPGTPYMGALLYHGVGVGKTCAAIQAAEAYLDSFPNRKVIIICPSAIRQGFRRTIFDFSERGLSIGSGNVPNAGRGCTANTYLHLTETLFERDPDVIRTRINKAIDRRYSFFGYIELRNYIRNVIKLRKSRQEIAYALRKEFNYRMIIIDEAHNLADYKQDQYDEDQEANEDTTDENDASVEIKVANTNDKSEGASLTSYLQPLLENTEGIKLLLMTATPMYNNVFEIYTLLNLLLLNDKKPVLEMASILNTDGSIAGGAELILKPIVNAYVSFMRGENPYSFPLRLFPEGEDPNGDPVHRLTVDQYPQYELGPTNENRVSDADKTNVSRLPIVLSTAGSDSSFKQLFNRSVSLKTSREVGGLSGNNVNYLLQVGNIIFPPKDGKYDLIRPQSYVGAFGFLNVFEKQKGSIRSKLSPEWLLNDETHLEQYSPKLATVLRYLKHGEGVQFVFSQFVISGALITAIALEANGYLPYGRPPILANPPPNKLGGQCAFCSQRKKEHTGADHEFKQARYGLLTGDKLYSPNLEDIVTAAVSPANKDGGVIKVIVGSKLASEGIDLKYIREVHILDAWWHMNRIEQIIGRGIRFCSHSALDKEKRNTTVFLHAIQTEQTDTMESADLYCYRIGMQKEVKKGKMSRLLKVFAVDCNLRKDVTILKGKGQRKQIDSQGQLRNGPNGEVQEEGDGVLLDDMPFSAVCDWMECEPIRCEPTVPIQITASDDSTYSVFSAKFRETSILKLLASIFSTQAWYREEELINILTQRGIPRTAIDIVLQQIVNNQLYRFKSGGQEGYLIYKNKYFLFQPEIYKSLQIPMALRIAQFPVKRDEYTPQKMNVEIVNRPLIPDENGEEPQDVSIQHAKSFWTSVQTWMQGVITGRHTKLGAELESKVELLTLKIPALKEIIFEKLNTILYLKTKIPADQLEVFKQICLDFVWDEFLHPTVQATLLLAEPNLSGREQVLEGQNMRVIRYIDPLTNSMRYMCADGSECDPEIAELLVRYANQKDDSISKRKADSNHAGDIYGFIASKKGNKLVFKTQEVRAPGVELDRGKECSIVSKGHSFKQLIQLGAILQKAGQPMMDLDEGHLAMVGHIINNSTKGCTMLDLVLRFMDALRIKNRRWFFRPISAYIAGLRGLIEPKGKKKGVAVAKAVGVPKAVAQIIKPAEKPIIKKEEKKAVVAPAAPLPSSSEEEEEEEIVVKPKKKLVVREEVPAPPVPAPALEPVAPVAPLPPKEATPLSSSEEEEEEIIVKPRRKLVLKGETPEAPLAPLAPAPEPPAPPVPARAPEPPALPPKEPTPPSSPEEEIIVKPRRKLVLKGETPEALPALPAPVPEPPAPLALPPPEPPKAPTPPPREPTPPPAPVALPPPPPKVPTPPPAPVAPVALPPPPKPAPAPPKPAPAPAPKPTNKGKKKQTEITLEDLGLENAGNMNF